MKKALVLTGQLDNWAGSEVLALEVAEVLSEKYKVTVAANTISERIVEKAKSEEILVTDRPQSIDLNEYKFIWSQHSVAPLCSGFEKINSYKGKFISAHLSPFESAELASLSYAKLANAIIIANSKETADKIEQITKMKVDLNFNNATNFGNQTKIAIKKELDRPRKILIISNHVPKELYEAVRIIKRAGVQIVFFGHGQKEYRRIRPEDYDESDAVITIGKSVQYAILRQRPVFCYDRFGGPGWITPKNSQRALDFNFSGRCSSKKKDPETIACEILNYYTSALSQTTLLYERYEELFNLAKVLHKLEKLSSKTYTSETDPMVIRHVASVIRTSQVTQKKLEEQLTVHRKRDLFGRAVHRGKRLLRLLKVKETNNRS